MEENFADISYKKHENSYSNSLFKKTLLMNKDTVDWWRHQRMYDTLNVLIEDNKESNWIGVGDGNYGHGTHHVLSKGSNCLATDISMNLLEQAKQNDYIKEYQYANAEKLPFKDNQFDFAFCKESYHHFPRPMIALYEMLRISKKGIILIEPNDAFMGGNLIRIFLRFIRKLLGKHAQRHSWESVGNYKFTISRREIEKVALGLNYKCIAFKGINDHWIKGAENEIYNDNGPINREITKIIKNQDSYSKYKLTDYALLSAIILKEEPSHNLINKLKRDGFEVIILPNNPYV